ncbi:olfactory receptor 5P60-like [Gastrophryne carolinensis]
MCEVNQTQVTQIRLLGFQGLNKLRILLFACFFLTYLVIVSGNLLIIILVTTVHKLKNPMFFFLKQLATSDILLTTIILPMALKVIIKDEGSTKAEDISLAACLTQLGTSGVFSYLQCFLLAVMSYDRYLAICNPLRYPVLMNSQVCLQLIIGLWILAVSIVSSEFIPICQLDFCDSNNIDHFFCEFESVLELTSSDISALITQDFILSIGTVFLPFGFILITYLYILVTVLKISSAQGQRKAFSTCISHLTTVGSFYGTIIIVYMVPSDESFASLNKYRSLLYIVVPPLLNPFIYSLRNHEIKSVLQKMFSNVNIWKYNK